MLGLAAVCDLQAPAGGDGGRARRVLKRLLKPIERGGAHVRTVRLNGRWSLALITPKGEADLADFRTFEDGVTVAFAGELFNGPPPSARSAVCAAHRLFRGLGSKSWKKLNGSFAAFVHDRKSGKAYVVSDRAGSVPVLYAKAQELLLISPDLRSFPASGLVGRQVDRAAAAAFLAGGYVHGERTFLEAAKGLGPAGCLRIRSARVERRRYWRYSPRAAFDGDQREAERALQRLLIQAVERCTRGHSRVGILLSGGNDSRALLGACRLLGKKVTAYTYCARPAPGGDSDVARRLAHAAGARFVRMPYKIDGLLRPVRRSIRPAGGMRNWPREYPAFAAHGRFATPVLAGDHAFGYKRKAVFADAEHVLRSVSIHRLAEAKTWRGLMRRAAWRELTRLDDASRRSLIGPPEPGSLAVLWDRLFFSQKLSRSLAPLRYSVRRFAPRLRSPWLDSDVLDFMAALPAAYRSEKRVFRGAAKRMFLKLFAIPAATGSDQWSDAELFSLIRRRWPGEIKRVAQLKDHPLAEWFEPAKLRRYFEPSPAGGGLKERMRALERLAILYVMLGDELRAVI